MFILHSESMIVTFINGAANGWIWSAWGSILMLPAAQNFTPSSQKNIHRQHQTQPPPLQISVVLFFRTVHCTEQWTVQHCTLHCSLRTAYKSSFTIAEQSLQYGQCFTNLVLGLNKNTFLKYFIWSLLKQT